MAFKHSLVKINGGFGNQLFQYCFADYLKRNGHSVKINNYWFQSVNDKFKRSEVFPPEFYGFESADKKTLKLYELSDRYLDQVSFPIFRNFDDYNYSGKNEGLLNYFRGSWQNSKYLNSSKTFLTNSLIRNEIIKSGLKSKPMKNSVMMHIRNKNYLGDELEISYFINSLNYLKSIIKDKIYVNVFSDNKNIIKNEKIAEITDNFYSPTSDSDEEVVNTFAKMLKNDHFIISNSTFSYMVAFLKSKNENITLMPNPWMYGNKNKSLKTKYFTEILRIK